MKNIVYVQVPICILHTYIYMMSQSMQGHSQKREPVWPNKFMHDNFVIFFNFSHYVCAPICTSFQSSSAGTWGASRSVVWLTKWHFVNTPTQRRVKPLKSILEKRSIQVTQYCVFRFFGFVWFFFVYLQSGEILLLCTMLHILIFFNKEINIC